jgi:UDP-glucuronate decarboxylase
MRILLTGAAGFLGSHLSTLLIREGHHVIGIDDLSTGSIQNLEQVLNNKNFELHEHDIRNSFEFDVEAILNFACPASPVHYQVDPVKTIETIFLGTTNVLHLARNRKAKVVQASTSEIYGDPTVSPQKETYWGNVNPIGIRSCYDEGKRAAETLCSDYRRQYGIDTKIIRIFNTYGPNMAVNDGRVVSNFIVQALKSENLTIYGDGTQTRSFCFVDDLIRAIYSTMNTGIEISGPINIGNPSEFTMLELAQIILKKTQSNSKIIFKSLPQDDPKQRKPDINQANELLDWHPEVTLDNGLDKTIEYFRKTLFGS